MQNNEHLNDFGKGSDGSGYAFISYSSKNKQKADAIRMLLKKKSIRTWMTPYDIPPGSTYAGVLNIAIKNCACVVLLLSADSQRSKHVLREMELAARNKKTIIPLQMDNVILNNDFEYYLAIVQIVSMHNIDEGSPEMKEIIAAIESHTGTKYHDNTEDKTVKFHDDDFEKAFRIKYDIKGDITLKTILGFTELDLSKSEPKLRDVSDIAVFKNLIYLNLGHNEINNIIPLTELVNLTKLFLCFNQISDITPLAGLMNLTLTDFGWNQISDITPLAGLANLSRLYLNGNRFGDITPLMRLVNLTKLEICGSQIGNIQWHMLKANLPNTEILW